jgi:4-hydroxyphenylpyruvate dioxygenase-like putative hemolysin
MKKTVVLNKKIIEFMYYLLEYKIDYLSEEYDKNTETHKFRKLNKVDHIVNTFMDDDGEEAVEFCENLFNKSFEDIVSRIVERRTYW